MRLLQLFSSCGYGKKNRFAVVVGTQITRFLIKMNHKISHLKALQRTTPSGLEYTRTLCQPPTSFLFIWLQKKNCFANVVGTQITRFVLIKTNHKISHLKGLQRTVSNIHIVYQNIVCPSYYFYLLMVVEINALRCYGMHTNKHDFGSEIMNNMVTDDYNRWVGAQTSTQCTRTLCFPPTIPGGSLSLD